MRAGCIVCHVELFVTDDADAVAAAAVADDDSGDAKTDAFTGAAIVVDVVVIRVGVMAVRSFFTCNSICS